MSDNLEELRELEIELHQLSARNNQSRLLELLHPDFVEFGRSGRRYSRDQIISMLTAETEAPDVIPVDFELTRIRDGAVLLTYVSTQGSASGKRVQRTRRASLWVREDQGWQVLFHQGTPIDG